jgi:hypothetical protein
MKDIEKSDRGILRLYSRVCMGGTEWNHVSLRQDRTNFMELSPSWEAASRSDTQENFQHSMELYVHYRIHKSPLLGPDLSQKNAVHITQSYLLKIHFNIILTRLGLHCGLFPSGRHTKIVYTFISMYAICPVHLILPDLIIRIIFGEVFQFRIG